jgi:tRNA threonylcarbamoyladenosine biosynthesis protein TsaB
VSRFLAVETATAVTAVALLGDGVAVEVVADDRRRHTEALAPAVDELMTAAGWAYSTLDGIVVDAGPGLFTGLRVGVAFAKGLSMATGVGIYDVTSTDVLAATAHAAGVRGRLLSVVDARRSEVFAATFECTDDDVATIESAALWAPAALAARVAEGGQPTTLVGDGALRHRDVFVEAAFAIRDDVSVPSPLSAARSAARRFDANEPLKTHPEVTVWYLRDADAVANFAVRGTRS